MHWSYFRHKATGEIVVAADPRRYSDSREYQESTLEEFLRWDIQIKADRISALEKALSDLVCAVWSKPESGLIGGYHLAMAQSMLPQELLDQHDRQIEALKAAWRR